MPVRFAFGSDVPCLPEVPAVPSPLIDEVSLASVMAAAGDRVAVDVQRLEVDVVDVVLGGVVVRVVGDARRSTEQLDLLGGLRCRQPR